MFHRSLNPHANRQKCFRETKKHPLVARLVATIKIKPKPWSANPALCSAILSAEVNSLGEIIGKLMMMILVGQKAQDSVNKLIWWAQLSAFLTKSQDATLRQKSLHPEDQWKECPSWQVGLFKKELLEEILEARMALQARSQSFKVKYELLNKKKFLLISGAHRVLPNFLFLFLLVGG